MTDNTLQSRISAARAGLNIGQEERAPDVIKIALASPAKVREWSRGEVKKPETINYRTFKPERDGLFCSAIFGPEKDYTCQCGKYNAIRFDGVTCEKCDVEVTRSSVRRERMGHIELACPVAHIWFVKSLPSRISLVLDMKQRDIEAVLYFEKYVVLNPGIFGVGGRGTTGDSGLKSVEERSTVVPEHYADYSSIDPNFEAVIGAEGLYEMLSDVDLDSTISEIEVKIKKIVEKTKQSNTGGKTRVKELQRRQRILQQFKDSGTRPEWMILKTLPVLPPGLRPLVPLEGDRFTSSDLNDLYRRIINRNNRLKKVMELNAPGIIVNNEKRMLQEAVDALIDNGRRGKAQTAHNSKRPLKSLADIVKGKSGRFRSNLLGKRVDFSGRTVIVVGPELKLHQCGLPKEMALELFKPWVYHLLEKRDHVQHLRQARKMVERREDEVWDCLDEAIKQHPVLLNRAPTLHRLGFQAFEPLLIEGRAIQLHPLVCAAFNADFDGDQMAVHVPLSHEAQIEARILMLSSNNMLSPANGAPVILPSQDIVLGLYYLTREVPGARGEGTKFASPEEAKLAYESGAVDLQAFCEVRITDVVLDGSGGEKKLPSRLHETTVGRAIMSLTLPRGMLFEQCNETMTKKVLGRLINSCIRNCDQRSTAIFADNLMRLGFIHSTKAGISIAVNDVVRTQDKDDIIKRAEKEVEKTQSEWENGLLSLDERTNKLTEVWKNAKLEVERSLTKMLAEEPAMRKAKDGKEVAVLDDAGNPVKQKSLNSIFMMVDSGARGSRDQLMQLAGMRGQMVKPDGDIIPTAVKTNFREGMNILEYFTSTHGGRKGLADTALKTANSGYLTRRLVDVTQHLVITEEDCGTDNGISLRQVSDATGVSVTLGTRALGRVLANAVVQPDGKKEMIEADTFVDEHVAEMLDKFKVTEVQVRSAVTCQTTDGLCARCYGRDLGRGKIVRIGEAVGVVAAQSIGEPGTQLTMRTFHTGGVAATAMAEREYAANSAGKISFSDIRTIVNKKEETVVVSNNGSVSVQDEHGLDQELHQIPYGAIIKVNDGDKVRKGTIISQQDSLTRPEISQYEGYARFVNVADDNFETQDGQTTKLVEGSKKTRSGQPELKLVRKILGDTAEAKEKEVEVSISTNNEKGKKRLEIPVRFTLSYGMTLMVKEGEKVMVGDVVAKAPLQRKRSADITRGLPRVIELFEARKPKQPGILAKATGVVNFQGIKRNKESWVITDDEGFEHEHPVPRGQTRIIHSGDHVYRGDMLFDGELDPEEILRVRGREALARYLVDEVQDVYSSEAVTINDKHIEVIVHQMLQRADITDPGSTKFIEGDQVSLVRIKDANDKAQREGGQPAKFDPVLLGITKAALNTDSVISAASFQETTKVLTEAAIKGARDDLRGLKENVIVGRLIPAGTGLHKERYNQREKNLLNERGVTLGIPKATDEATAEAETT